MYLRISPSVLFRTIVKCADARKNITNRHNKKTEKKKRKKKKSDILTTEKMKSLFSF